MKSDEPAAVPEPSALDDSVSQAGYELDWRSLIDALQSAEDDGQRSAAQLLRLVVLWLRSRREPSQGSPAWEQADFLLAERCLGSMERRGQAAPAYCLAQLGCEQANRNQDPLRATWFTLRAALNLTALCRVDEATARLSVVLGDARAVSSWAVAASNLTVPVTNAGELRRLRVLATYTVARLHAALGRYLDADQALGHALSLAERGEAMFSPAELSFFRAELRLDAGDLAGCRDLQEAQPSDAREGALGVKWQFLDANVRAAEGQLSVAVKALAEVEERARTLEHPATAEAARWRRVNLLATMNRLDEAQALLDSMWTERDDGSVRRLLALIHGRRALHATFVPSPTELKQRVWPSLKAEGRRASTPSATPHVAGETPARGRQCERFREEFAVHLQDLQLALDRGELGTALAQLSYLRRLCQPVQSRLIRAELTLAHAQLAHARGEPITAAGHAAKAEELFEGLGLPLLQREACMVRWLSCDDPASALASALLERMSALSREVQRQLTSQDEELFLLNKWSTQDGLIRSWLPQAELPPRSSTLLRRLDARRRSRALYRLLCKIDEVRGWNTVMTRRGHDQDKSAPAEAPARVQSARGLLPLRSLGPGWLARGTALLYYVALPDRLLLFSVIDGRCDLHVTSVSRVVLWQLCDRAGWDLRFADRNLSPSSDPGALQRLAEVLSLTTLSERLRARTQHLYIVPDDILVQIPFAALPMAGASLCTRFSISLVPYPRWAQGGKVSTPGTRALAIADATLPGASDELASLREVVSTVTCLEGSEARSERVLGELTKHDLLYFACHGQFDGQNPLRSGFKLQSDSGERWLTLSDLSRGCFQHVRFAFLHACWSAGVSVLPGRELVGIGTTLVRLGCRSLVMALWPVQEGSAADFARTFLPMVGGKGAAVALAQAQTRWSDRRPQAWAHYVVYEDGLRSSGLRRIALAAYWFVRSLRSAAGRARRWKRIPG